MYQSPPSAGSKPVLAAPTQRPNAAFYAAQFDAFLAASDAEAYAPLAAPEGYTLAPKQLSAWHLQLPVLREALADLPVRSAARPVPRDQIEFDIPRLDRWVDAALITPTALALIELKGSAKGSRGSTTSGPVTTGSTSRTFMSQATEPRSFHSAARRTVLPPTLQHLL